MSKYLVQEPEECMSPGERMFDWCLNTAFSSPAWSWIVFPIRKLLVRSQVRSVRVAGRISPWLLLPYTSAAALLVASMCLTLIIAGLLAIGWHWFEGSPKRIRDWWRRQ
jgi:amino acid permease